MNCQHAVELLTELRGEASAEDRRAALEHAVHCEDCRGAVAAVHELRLAGLAPGPSPRAGAFERAVTNAANRAPPRRAVGGFWLGLSLGAGLAASIAAAVVGLGPAVPPAEPAATPSLALALNEPRDINISLTSDETFADAEIHVVLNGAVGLDGYPGQRELRWRTQLDAGVNRLSLPVVATGAQGGQLLVEVLHGGKRRSFLVDVIARV